MAHARAAFRAPYKVCERRNFGPGGASAPPNRRQGRGGRPSEGWRALRGQGRARLAIGPPARAPALHPIAPAPPRARGAVSGREGGVGASAGGGRASGGLPQTF